MGIAGSTSSACPRVGVDLFHVPHMLGEETYHLIALREDWDSRSPLEVTGLRFEIVTALTALTALHSKILLDFLFIGFDVIILATWLAY